jgi:hypothetical protein
LPGIIDDFWQRPIESVDEIESRKWMGDGSIPKMGLIKAAEFQWMAKNPGKIRVP